MALAHEYLARHDTPFAAYCALQARLMGRYCRLRGCSEHDWCTAMAPTFRRRYGWMLACDA